MNAPKIRTILLETGKKYNRLTIIGVSMRSGRNTIAVCRCDCGTEKEIYATHVRTGHIKSCGCLRVDRGRANATHGKSHSGAYKSWTSMLSRCRNPNDGAYPMYGARGISFCKRWNDFTKFYADMGDRPAGHSIDRINNYKNYSPGNCRWATCKEQSQNKRNNVYVEFNGEKLCVSEWSRRNGIPTQTIRGRLERGWDGGQAVSTPPEIHVKFCYRNK
jgi:hypothetical protein